jgi:hypothetical protein
MLYISHATPYLGVSVTAKVIPKSLEKSLNVDHEPEP